MAMESVVKVPPSLTLKGRRLVLSSPNPQDDEAMRVIFSDPSNVRHLPVFQRSGQWTIQEIVARRESQIADQQQNKSLVLYIHIQRPNGYGEHLSGSVDGMIVAGTTGFRTVDLKSCSAELGVIVHHHFCGNGLATEAMHLCLSYGFEFLGLQRVDWFTDKDNQDMRGWLEGFLGLEPVGALESCDKDMVGYSLSRSEWQERVNPLLEWKIGVKETREAIDHIIA
ncbi:hypothetical protein O6H91_01G072300 [Diphasiastrum complanatum]|uniref:Uncharacterized protein n=1 Tax=Diphasiastrum complanatum TaxID=34168 RepID=A0ACC2ES56_DIPCM|nr:hypothetical protein O6H91_Y354300 [Diphasiastrum complanatum]KAJ7569314.1 hypothetical protein O6H91_01G072300 [Diphasiastrum complanatum]